jgi:hypothetical protein
MFFLVTLSFKNKVIAVFSLTRLAMLVDFNKTNPKKPTINNTKEILKTTEKYDERNLRF